MDRNKYESASVTIDCVEKATEGQYSLTVAEVCRRLYLGAVLSFVTSPKLSMTAIMSEHLYSPIHGRKIQYNVESNTQNLHVTKLNYSTKRLL